MALLLGVDVGTQSLRACLFREDGRKVAEHSEPLRTTYPAQGWAEQDPLQWWTTAVRSIRQVLETRGVDRTDVVALSYACTSCTVVALDEHGWPIRPALLWMDERAADEARRITKRGGLTLRYCGGTVSPQWMLPKTAWLQTHEPDTFRRAYRIVEQTDFFTYRLTGRWTLDYGNLVAKWNYSTRLGGWPEGFIEEIGLEAAQAKWPTEVLPVGSPVGLLTPEAAAETGLCPETLVVQGGVDSHAGMVGLSIVEDGGVAVVMGTSTVLMAQSDEPIFADIWGPYPDALIPGTFTLGGGQTTTGSVIQWLGNLFESGCRETAGSALPALEREAALVPPGSGGLVALDYFQGNRTPRKDTRARGAIWGLTLWHTPAQVLRAFHEANAFGTRHILENLAEHGFRTRRIVAGGGGSRSALAVQVLADVCGQPIGLAREEQNTALGAAIWAGLGSGVFASYLEATRRMVHVDRAIESQPANREAYDFYFDRYLRTYEQLAPLMHEVVDFETRRALEPTPA